MTKITSSEAGSTPDAYEAPALIEVGGVYELTLTGGHGGCWHDKKWGGSDGVKFLNIQIPISSC